MAKKYGAKVQQKVKKVVHEFKKGTLKSGLSGEKMESRKQAVAIGLSEARRSGAKIPRTPFTFEESKLPVVRFKEEPANVFVPERHELLNFDLIFQRIFS